MILNDLKELRCWDFRLCWENEEGPFKIHKTLPLQKNTDIASSPSLGPSTDLFKGPASCFHHNQTVYSVNNAERNRNNQYFEGVHQPFIECGKRTLCMPNHWLQRCPCVTERVIITPPCDVQAFTVLAGEGENGRVLWCTLSRVSSEGCCEQQKRWQCRWKCLSLKKELGKKEVNKIDGEKC